MARVIEYYNLEAILSVGYRVRSPRGAQFRRWATERLSGYLVKGFTMDDERLRNPPVEGQGIPDYFDELLERIRDIRARERRVYLRVREIFALAVDYQPSKKDMSVFDELIALRPDWAGTRRERKGQDTGYNPEDGAIRIVMTGNATDHKRPTDRQSPRRPRHPARENGCRPWHVLLDGRLRLLRIQNRAASSPNPRRQPYPRPRRGKKRYTDVMASVSKAYSLCSTLDEAAALREEIAFFSAVRAVIIKDSTTKAKLSKKTKDSVLKQILDNAVLSEGVVDVFGLAGLEKPNISLLSDEFLEDVKKLPQRNLAVELLERLLRDQIRARARTNVVQEKKYGDRLLEALRKYHNRSIETAQVIEELVAMARDFQDALNLLRKYKYPPVGQEAAVARVIEQAEALADSWTSCAVGGQTTDTTLTPTEIDPPLLTKTDPLTCREAAID